MTPTQPLLASLLLLGGAFHEGPDPVMAWRFREADLRDGRLVAVLGPDPVISGKPVATPGPDGGSLMFDGEDDRIVLADDLSQLGNLLPKKHFTVSTWVSVNSPQPYGGIFSVIQDNGGHEKGWVLGYGQKHFFLGLATKGADDGDGFMTYLSGSSIFELGRMYHVVATYDGEEMKLYVNGRLEASTAAQSGDILYPEKAPVVLGGYLDDNENFLHHGRIREITLYDQTASPKWVEEDFRLNGELAESAPLLPLDPDFTMKVDPFLQFGTEGSMTMVWETSRPSTSILRWGEKVLGEDENRHLPHQVVGPKEAFIHTVTLDGLDPGKGYFYQVESTDSEGRDLTSPILTFQTAVQEGTPFAFAVISDTQSNPAVSGKIAEMAWGMRPHFLVHPGDLVGTGTNKRHWLKEFFPSMNPLLARVPMYPVLGNHEQDARFYYEYMALPQPEYFYDFRYGDAHFFMVDSNRNVGPGSEQYVWLKKRLASSKARWKFVSYHHPSYTSDENDYGDMWSGPSTHGDLRIRALMPLFDQYGVDIVWNGHIHSYERTWPLKGGKVVETGGTIYMITGGGGGGLETPGPVRPWFQNNVRQGHHWCYIAVNGGTLEMKAFDLEGRLFDVLTLRKP